MKAAYRLVNRKGMFYLHNNATGRRTSLHTAWHWQQFRDWTRKWKKKTRASPHWRRAWRSWRTLSEGWRKNTERCLSSGVQWAHSEWSLTPRAVAAAAARQNEMIAMLTPLPTCWSGRPLNSCFRHEYRNPFLGFGIIVRRSAAQGQPAFGCLDEFACAKDGHDGCVCCHWFRLRHASNVGATGRQIPSYPAAVGNSCLLRHTVVHRPHQTISGATVTPAEPLSVSMWTDSGLIPKGLLSHLSHGSDGPLQAPFTSASLP